MTKSGAMAILGMLLKAASTVSVTPLIEVKYTTARARNTPTTKAIPSPATVASPVVVRW